MRQIILFLLAGICFIAAVLSMPLPLPLGFVFTVLGLSLILVAVPPMQRRFQAIRVRFPVVDRRIQWAESYLPGFVRRALNGERDNEAE